jgi:hypothetical protein
MTGKILLEREMASPGKKEIDLSNYPKGYYTLRLSCGDGIKVEKVVIY